RTFTTSPIWPSFSTRSSRMTCMGSLLFHDVRQKRHETRALDGEREQTLLAGGHRGDARRHDLAALRDEALQELHVLVVDPGRIGAGERTGFLAPEKRAPLAGLAHSAVSWVVSPSGLRSPPSRSRRALLELDCSNWSTFTVRQRSTSS